MDVRHPPKKFGSEVNKSTDKTFPKIRCNGRCLSQQTKCDQHIIRQMEVLLCCHKEFGEMIMKFFVPEKSEPV